MPRVVDHDQRKNELAQATWSLIRKEGLAGVTIRKLSEQSGWSSGAIRHYLPNREAILNFAAEQINQQAERRIRSLEFGTDQRDNFLKLLWVLLPIDKEVRLWMEVWLAFVAAAVSNENFADTQGLIYRNLHRVLNDIFRDFKTKGWLPHHTPLQAANELQAVIDGLSVHLLLRQIKPDQAKKVVSATLERMLIEPNKNPITAPSL